MLSETAPAKLNLTLHVRGKLSDGRHALETIFAFCTDGDLLQGQAADELTLDCDGPFAASIDGDNLVMRAARALAEIAAVESKAALRLTKNLPVASGIGGGSADAAAALRMLTRLWRIDPAHASAVAPSIGADVPACLLSMTARGSGAGDALTLIDAGISGASVLLVNPQVKVSTRDVFAAWDGVDRGPLLEWRAGRNDLKAPARSLAPALGARHGVDVVRMSGSGATCFALFADEMARDQAAARCPANWWHLATHLR